LFRSLLRYVRLTTEALSRIEFVLAATTIVVGLAFWTWADFADARHNAEIKVSTAALAMDELVGRSLLVIDVVLESVVTRIEEQGLDKLGSEPERERLNRMASRLPETGAVFIADKAGDVVASTASYAFPVNVSDREWFGLLQDGKAELYVGRALKGRTIHGLFFPVARAIRGPGGTFLGAAQVGIEVTYIAYLFGRLDIGSGAHLGLYRTQDGAVVARYPMTEALLDETIATMPYFSGLAKSQIQSWTGWTHSTGQERIFSARRVNGWPLIASASLTKGEVYSGAWSRLLWRTLAAALAISALLMLTALAIHQAKREASLRGELSHRVKNILAVLGAVIERAREHSQSMDELVSSLRGRIKSMSDTQALLSQNQARGVSLDNLILGELEPYATGNNTSLNGPAVYLTSSATHAVAMVIHELTTNAAKYGALSRSNGRVSVQWTLTTKDPSVETLTLEWKETGGPEVSVPARQGYGSSVIRDLLAYELGGRSNLVFAADGVRCTIELPAHSTIETFAASVPRH